MKILFAYDGSAGADAAIATVGKLVGGGDVEAVVLSIWEPLTVAALRAVRFGGPMPLTSDVDDIDDASEHQAHELAEHGVRLATDAGFAAGAMSGADTRDIPAAIIAASDEVDADIVVLGARGLTGVAAFLGSVSNHVVQHAHRPVLVVPPHHASAASEQADSVAATES
jgi:nucleotide-binding universal stress UspA family protein